MRRLACLLLVTMMLCPLNFMFVQAAEDDYTTTLDSDTTWIRGSFHKLSKTLVIPAGVTLTIEPGVWVDLWDCRINVYGTLNASGSVDNRITFTSSVDRNSGLFANSIQPDGLWFDRASSSLFLNTRVVGSRMDISGSLNVINSSLQGFVEVDHGSSVFTNSEIAKMNIFNGSSTLTNNEIDSLGLIGGTPIVTGNNIESCSINGGSPTLTGNTFNGRTSVSYSDIYQAGLTVISGNQFFAPIGFGSSNPRASTATLTNNVFTVSTDPIITVGPGVNVTVSNNDITGTNNSQTAITVQGDGYVSYGVNSKAQTLTNINIGTAAAYASVTGNRISNCQTGIYIAHGSVQIINNTIFGNNLGVKINPAYYNYAQDDTIIEMRQNRVINNSVGIEIVSSLASKSLTHWLSNDNMTSFMNAQFLTPQMFLSQANLTDYQTPLNITNNDIYGNTEYNLRLSSSDNETKLDFNVANNWWGTTDEVTISQSIYDGKNDSNLGLVTSTPYAGQALEQEVNPETNAPVSNPILLIASGAVAIFCVAIAVIILRKRVKINRISVGSGE